MLNPIERDAVARLPHIRPSTPSPLYNKTTKTQALFVTITRNNTAPIVEHRLGPSRPVFIYSKGERFAEGELRAGEQKGKRRIAKYSGTGAGTVFRFATKNLLILCQTIARQKNDALFLTDLQTST